MYSVRNEPRDEKLKRSEPKNGNFNYFFFLLIFAILFCYPECEEKGWETALNTNRNFSNTFFVHEEFFFSEENAKKRKYMYKRKRKYTCGEKRLKKYQCKLLDFFFQTPLLTAVKFMKHYSKKIYETPAAIGSTILYLLLSLLGETVRCSQKFIEFTK